MTPAPVIVVSGLPRSGTSLLMAILHAAGVPLYSDGRRAADASNPHGYHEHEAVKHLASDATWLPRAAGHAVKIVVPLVRHLPAGLPARVLLLDRAVDEILASQAAMLARAGRSAAPATVLAPVFARLWQESHQALLAAAPAVQTLVVPHRVLIHEPATILPRIVTFLGLTVDPMALRCVIDPSLHRERR